MAYIPKGNSAWLLRKAINRSDSAIADLETNLTTLARTASNTGTSTTTQVLFNDAGIVNGDAGLVYNKTTDALSVGGTLGVTGAATLSSTLAVTGTSTLTGAATVQGLTLGKGNGAYATNTAFGSGCLAAVTANSGLLALGAGCMPIVTSGSNNVGAGNRCLEALTSGASNTAVGTLSLATISTQDENTAIGRGALIYSVGGQNTAIGYSAGGNHSVGSNNAFFGANAQPSNSTISHEYTYGGGAVLNHRFPNGNVTVGNGNVVMSTIGKGIDFSATAGAGTMTSELLADYEEGTWVPVDASGASPALVFTVSECKYTKIGRAVTIQGVITYPSTVTTNGARFTGLPFAFVGMAPFSISYASSVAVPTNASFLIAHFSAGPLFYELAGGQTQNAFLSGSTIWFFGTYMI